MSRGLLSARLQTVTRSRQPSHTTRVVDRDDDLLPDPCRAPVRTIFQSPAGFDQLTNRSSKFMPLFRACWCQASWLLQRAPGAGPPLFWLISEEEGEEDPFVNVH